MTTDLETLLAQGRVVTEKLRRRINAPGKRGPSPREREAADMLDKLLVEIERQQKALALIARSGAECSVCRHGRAMFELATSALTQKEADRAE